MIRAVSGRTFASKVVTLFESNIKKFGATNKLNLMFGSFEPFIAFFALSRLNSGPSGSVFKQLPNPGAAMVFELFTVGGDPTVYPSRSDLWVRFLYRNGTDAGATFVEYALFGNGNSQSRMKYDDFVTSMTGIGINSYASWCNICQSISIFCPALQDNSSGGSGGQSNSGGGSTLSPVVAGVIGAIVAVVVSGWLSPLCSAGGAVINAGTLSRWI